jgi:ABC-2 type transport system permease protein
MRDVGTVLWKELKELSSTDGAWVTLTTILVFMLFVGVVIPWLLGIAWLRAPWSVIMWAWIPFFVVTTVTADSVAGERERRTLETLLATRLPDASIVLGKVLAAVVGVWSVTVLCLPLGTVTVNMTVAGGPHVPPLSQVAALFAVVLFASTLGAALGVLVSIRADSVRQAQQTLAISAIALFLGPIVLIRLLPERWTGDLVAAMMLGSPVRSAVILAGILALATAPLLGLALIRFRRRRIPLR